MSQNKLVGYEGLSRKLGPPSRTLRTWVSKGKISCYRMGHRTVLFDPEKVRRELNAFEAKAVTNPKSTKRTVMT
jgi:hypothetical protein